MSTPPRKLIHLPKVRLVSRGGRQATGLRITNVKSIRPPDPDILKKQEEDKLRAQLQKEIVSRSRGCSYRRYRCPLPVVGGRSFCARHILLDPTAPYARCSHDRCTMPARQAPHDPDLQLCFEHARAALAARQRAAAPPPPVTTSETLLHRLQHYVRPERVRTESCTSSVSVVSDPADQEVLPQAAVDPFKQIDARAVNAAYSASIMECASASDSDGDSVEMSGAEPGPDLSDPEDAPAEDTPLWRAGVYTAEEAVRAARDTVRALQAAYRDQAAGLAGRLRAARARFLRAHRSERDHCGSINSQALSGQLSVRERRQLRKLKAYASYRRRHGTHAVLARKLLHKRATVHDLASSRSKPSGSRCTFTEGGVRCSQPNLPAAKHCLKHITHDTNQVLFAVCGDPRGGVSCREPLPRLPLPAACRYHAAPPHYTVFTLKKDDSESGSESDSSGDSQTTHCETEDAPSAADRAHDMVG